MLPNQQDACGYNQDYFDQLVAEQRILKFTSGGFAKYEWHKNRTDPNEAMDLRCYTRAALEYLRVRLEQIPKDVIKNFNPQNIKTIEIGLGRSILIEGNLKNEQRRNKLSQRQSTSTLAGLDTEERGSQSPTTTAARTPQYGAVGSAF